LKMGGKVTCKEVAFRTSKNKKGQDAVGASKEQIGQSAHEKGFRTLI